MAMPRMLSLIGILLVSVVLAVSSSAQPVPASETSATAQAEGSETDRLNQWFEMRFEEQLQFSPISLTYMGRKELYDQLDDFSEAGADAELDWQRQTVEEMEREFDYHALTPEAQTSYDLWRYQYDAAAAARAFRGNQYIFTQFGSIQASLPTLMINMHRVDEPSDMDAYVARVGAVGRAINQLTDRAERYAERGVRPPRFAFDGVITQSRALITGAPFDTSDDEAALWSDARAKIASLRSNGRISEEAAAELEDAARVALVDEFRPAYERLIRWAEYELARGGDTAVGASALPDGVAFYDHRLKASTTTDMTTDDVHGLGLREVKRLCAEMEDILAEVDFDGDLAAFFEFVRESEQFYFPNTDEGRQRYLDGAAERLDSINERLPEYFGVLPRAELVVRRVEPFREQDGAAQHYSPGAPDGSRPGVYYAHLSDMNAMPRTQLEVIAYHEGNPGHHMQIAIAQELEDVPTFRTQARFTAYIEGWGLYAELLALEMGAYDDPYSNFGRLGSEMWRALRLVVDTGLHSKGWTEQQAIDYMRDNSSESLERVTSEVRRYIVMPGQATAYKVGMLKFQELRARAEEALGSRFDLRGFHDTVLAGGPLPLALLERRVDRWVASIPVP